MQLNGWRYYNHAAVPTAKPHEEVNIAPIEDGSIWKMDGKPMMARWTSEFDCGYETQWWYLIKDTAIVLEELSSHSRKHIRQALNKCEIKRIQSEEFIEQLYECSHAAFEKYKNAENEQTKEQFVKECLEKDNKSYWAGFENESGRLIGYMIVKEFDDYAEIATSKFHPDFLNTHISDALYFVVLNYYLQDCGVKYVSSGQRNINHVTNTQEYKEKTLGYRKAFCKMNIIYRFPLNIAVKIAYPLRGILKKLEHIGMVHQFVSILKMEEIRRSFLN